MNQAATTNEQSTSRRRSFCGCSCRPSGSCFGISPRWSPTSEMPRKSFSRRRSVMEEVRPVRRTAAVHPLGVSLCDQHHQTMGSRQETVASAPRSRFGRGTREPPRPTPFAVREPSESSGPMPGEAAVGTAGDRGSLLFSQARASTRSPGKRGGPWNPSTRPCSGFGRCCANASNGPSKRENPSHELSVHGI